MTNILIVDDEPLIRKVLKELVNWAEHDFQIVGDAYNGEEAHKKFQFIPRN